MLLGDTITVNAGNFPNKATLIFHEKRDPIFVGC